MMLVAHVAYAVVMLAMLAKTSQNNFGLVSGTALGSEYGSEVCQTSNALFPCHSLIDKGMGTRE